MLANTLDSRTSAAAGKRRLEPLHALALAAAIVNAAISRARPVGLAAGTTVLGVIPLLQDVFWVGLAVTVMAGLTFGTVLTLVLVPVLYSTLYGLKDSASA